MLILLFDLRSKDSPFLLCLSLIGWFDMFAIQIHSYRILISPQSLLLLPCVWSRSSSCVFQSSLHFLYCDFYHMICPYHITLSIGPIRLQCHKDYLFTNWFNKYLSNTKNWEYSNESEIQSFYLHWPYILVGKTYY